MTVTEEMQSTMAVGIIQDDVQATIRFAQECMMDTDQEEDFGIVDLELLVEDQVQLDHLLTTRMSAGMRDTTASVAHHREDHSHPDATKEIISNRLV